MPAMNGTLRAGGLSTDVGAPTGTPNTTPLGYFDTAATVFYVWPDGGSAWQAVGGSGTVSPVATTGSSGPGLNAQLTDTSPPGSFSSLIASLVLTNASAAGSISVHLSAISRVSVHTKATGTAAPVFGSAIDPGSGAFLYSTTFSKMVAPSTIIGEYLEFTPPVAVDIPAGATRTFRMEYSVGTLAGYVNHLNLAQVSGFLQAFRIA